MYETLPKVDVEINSLLSKSWPTIGLPNAPLSNDLIVQALILYNIW